MDHYNRLDIFRKGSQFHSLLKWKGGTAMLDGSTKDSAQ